MKTTTNTLKSGEMQETFQQGRINVKGNQQKEPKTHRDQSVTLSPA